MMSDPRGVVTVPVECPGLSKRSSCELFGGRTNRPLTADKTAVSDEVCQESLVLRDKGVRLPELPRKVVIELIELNRLYSLVSLSMP